MNWKNAAGLKKHLPKLSDFDKFCIRNLESKIEVCEEQREGWPGKMPFYIFWCPNCENYSYDYPQGFAENRRLYCHRCDERVDFVLLRTEMKMLLSALWCGISIRFGRKK